MRRTRQTREGLLGIFEYQRDDQAPRLSLAKLREQTSDEEEARLARLAHHLDICKLCARGLYMKQQILCMTGRRLRDELVFSIEEHAVAT